MTFGRAFDLINNKSIKIGMRLPEWNDDVLVKVQYPDDYSKMTEPYLYIESRFGRAPWKENMIELFRCDWEVVQR